MLLAIVSTCCVKNSVNKSSLSEPSLACLCSVTWFFIARFMAFKSGTTKISEPHTHLTIGILFLCTADLPLLFWPEVKLISWTLFFFMPTNSKLVLFLIFVGASELLYSASHISRCDRLGAITSRKRCCEAQERTSQNGRHVSKRFEYYFMFFYLFWKLGKS